jgi:hypothetical protein
MLARLGDDERKALDSLLDKCPRSPQAILLDNSRLSKPANEVPKPVFGRSIFSTF